MRPHPTAKLVARFSPRPSFGVRGFTLIELLAVIAISGLLAAITLGAMRDISRRAALSRARVELAILAQALEAYQRRHGDYPRTADPARFYAALDGKLGPAGASASGRAFIEIARFTLRQDDSESAGNQLLDPWGRPYVYAYKSQAPWTNPSYVLYSTGPDGRDSAGLLAGGFPDYATPENAGNLYAGRD